VEYAPKDLRMAIVESSEGRVGSLVDELLLYCYHYDPATGRYGAIAMNVVRLGGAVTVALLGGFIWLMRRRESYVV
jgi:protein SCO1/2